LGAARRPSTSGHFTIRDRLQHAIVERWDVLQRIANEAQTPTRCFEFGQRVPVRRRAATLESQNRNCVETV
jgi:hypothetical protein